MIYFVTNQTSLFDLPDITQITADESIKMMESWASVQYDSETQGKNSRLCDLLCVQFGNKEGDVQIVVDTTTVDIRLYKNILEQKLVIGHNLKFDLQFLYNYNIIPRRVYDTMIVEQMLYLGFPSSMIKYSLAEVAWRRLKTDIDKSVRGEIIWRGLDAEVIHYAANDVKYLYSIMESQLKDCRERHCMIGAKLECDCVPAMAYLEWCGVKLDESRWKAKMEKDKKGLEEAKKRLDSFALSTSVLKEFTKVNTQGDLFEGFNLEPICTINWSSSQQVVKVAKLLGFNTVTKDKKTGEDKDSVLEKLLATQKGINDEFLKLYFDYQEKFKVVTSFGQGHLNAVNPKTGRLHTIYKQLGAASGRMSCGSQQPDTDLAKYKKLKPSDCTFPNIQQLPHDEETRACFIAEEGNLWVSCDYSAQEGRVQGDIYQDEAILKMYREGIDGHSMYAKIFFKDELKDVDVHDVKKLRPDLRTKAKSPEFEK